MVELNKTVLKEIKVKKADRHQVLSRDALRQTLEHVRTEGQDIYDKAVIILTELIRRHPFTSGVRRTALVAAMSFLRMNGEEAMMSQDPKVLQGIREGFYTRDEVKAWLKGHAIREFKRK